MIQKKKIENNFDVISNAVTCQQYALLNNKKKTDSDLVLTNKPHTHIITNAASRINNYMQNILSA